MSKKNEGRIGSPDWAERPPTHKELYIPIYSPKYQRAVQLVIVGPDLRGVFTHHSEKRTRPCTIKDGECPDCERGIPRRWKGYVAGWDAGTARYALGEITGEAYRKCPELAKLQGRLRGWIIKTTRIHEHRNAPCRAALTPGGSGLVVPEPFDIATALYVIWGNIRQDELELG